MHHPPVAFAKHYKNWTDPKNGRDLLGKRRRLLTLLAEGGVQIVVSEHHGSIDGYLPSPLVLAAAIAARTRRL